MFLQRPEEIQEPKPAGSPSTKTLLRSRTTFPRLCSVLKHSKKKHFITKNRDYTSTAELQTSPQGHNNDSRLPSAGAGRILLLRAVLSASVAFQTDSWSLFSAHKQDSSEDASFTPLGTSIPPSGHRPPAFPTKAALEGSRYFQYHQRIRQPILLCHVTMYNFLFGTMVLIPVRNKFELELWVWTVWKSNRWTVNNWHLNQKCLPQNRTRTQFPRAGAECFTVNPSCKGILLFILKLFFLKNTK